MVKQDKRGFRDWVIQRVTAVFLAFYFAYLLAVLFLQHDAGYQYWNTLFSNTWLKVLSVIALLAIAWHAWIGLWTVLTDYVKSVPLRRFLEVLICASFFVYIVWGMWLLWLI